MRDHTCSSTRFIKAAPRLTLCSCDTECLAVIVNDHGNCVERMSHHGRRVSEKHVRFGESIADVTQPPLHIARSVKITTSLWLHWKVEQA